VSAAVINLTGSLRQLAKVIGVEDALRIAAAYRGRELAVPIKVAGAAYRRWAQHVSKEALDRLCASGLAGNRICFPTTLAHGDKKRRVAELGHLPALKVAEVVGCTVSYVNRVRKQLGGAW
jgi:hypothetical protein